MKPIVIAIDGTSASGKSTNSKLVAQALGFVHVDTGAMYRTLAWYCLQHRVDVQDAKAVAAACRRWKTSLRCADNHVQLVVEGSYPAQEIRTAEVSAAVAHVAAVPKVREWMTTAVSVPGFIGFAVGRTVFWDPLVDYRANKITRDAAVQQIAAKYRQWVDVFEKAK